MTTTATTIQTQLLPTMNAQIMIEIAPEARSIYLLIIFNWHKYGTVDFLLA